MAVRLGIPDSVVGVPLSRRLAWLTGARLLFLFVLLALIGFFFLRRGLGLGSFTVRAALIVLTVSFCLAGIYAGLLRSGRRLTELADAQLVLDQLTWTAVVYLSGGAASGATSFYGLSCLVGAILTGMRGSAIAGVPPALLRLLLLGLQTGRLPPPPINRQACIRGARTRSSTTPSSICCVVIVTLLAGYLQAAADCRGRLIIAEERAVEAEAWPRSGAWLRASRTRSETPAFDRRLDPVLKPAEASPKRTASFATSFTRSARLNDRSRHDGSGPPRKHDGHYHRCSGAGARGGRARVDVGARGLGRHGRYEGARRR